MSSQIRHHLRCDETPDAVAGFGGLALSAGQVIGEWPRRVPADHRGDDGQVLGRQVGGFLVTFPAKEPCAAAVGSTTGSSPSGWGCETAPSSRRCAASGEDHGRCLSWLGEDLGDLFGDQDAPVVVSRVMVRFLEGQRDSGCLGARPHGGNGARPSASSCPRGMPCVKKHTLCTMLTSGA